jgi:hypothetical protein
MNLRRYIKKIIKEETPCGCTGGVGCCGVSHHCSETEKCTQGCCVPNGASTKDEDDDNRISYGAMKQKDMDRKYNMVREAQRKNRINIDNFLYGTRDEKRGRRLDEQWSGIAGDPCCPVAGPNAQGWFAYNHYDNNGNPCIGGCGDQKLPMAQPVAEKEMTRKEKSGGLVHYKPHPNWCCEWTPITCFAKGDKVEMSDGTMKAIDLIEIGDEVKSGRDGETGIVSETLVHPVNDVVQVVNINGITAEPYHPVLVNNEWIPIKKLGNISNKFIGDWYNLKIEGNTDTNYIIGDLIVSGLGNDCQRLLKDSDKRSNQLIKQI